VSSIGLLTNTRIDLLAIGYSSVIIYEWWFKKLKLSRDVCSILWTS